VGCIGGSLRQMGAGKVLKSLTGGDILSYGNGIFSISEWNELFLDNGSGMRTPFLLLYLHRPGPISGARPHQRWMLGKPPENSYFGAI